MEYISSSFSLQMLPQGGNIKIIPLERRPVFHEIDGRFRCELYGEHNSAVGHQGTADSLSRLAGYKIPCQRISIKLEIGDTLLVAQPVGERLAVGSELSELKLAFFNVKVEAPHKCKTLRNYWSSEIAEVLKERGFGINPNEFEDNES